VIQTANRRSLLPRHSGKDVIWHRVTPHQRLPQAVISKQNDVRMCVSHIIGLKYKVCRRKEHATSASFLFTTTYSRKRRKCFVSHVLFVPIHAPRKCLFFTALLLSTTYRRKCFILARLHKPQVSNIILSASVFLLPGQFSRKFVTTGIPITSWHFKWLIPLMILCL
jgi:hypothetical protein